MFFFTPRGAENLIDNLENMGTPDEELIEDPQALSAAQAAVNAVERGTRIPLVDDSWVAVFGPTEPGALAGNTLLSVGGLTVPLDAEGIAYAWDPYPPEAGTGLYSRPFTLLVPQRDAVRAAELLGGVTGAATPPAASAPPSRTSLPAPRASRPHSPGPPGFDPAASSRRQVTLWASVLVIVLAVAILYFSGLLARLSLIRP